MANVHGSKAVFKLNDTGNTARDLSTYIKKVSFKRSVDSAETSTMGTVAKSYIPGLTDATIDVEGLFDLTAIGYLDGIIAGLAAGTYLNRAWEYGPGGNTASSGQPKYTGVAILTGYDPGDADIGGAVAFTFSLQVSGSITVAAY